RARADAAHARRQLAVVDSLTRASRAHANVPELADSLAGELCDAFAGAHFGLHVLAGGHLELVARRATKEASMLEDAPEFLRRMPIDGSSVQAAAIRERRTLVSRLADLSERGRQALASEGVEHMLVTPLLVGDVVIGTISVASRRATSWDASELGLFERAAERIAAELHAGLVSEERRRARDLELFQTIGELVSQELSLDAVLRAATSALARVVEVPRVTVMLADDGLLRSAACTDDVFADVVVPIESTTLAGLAFRSGEPVVFADAQNDPRSYRELVERVGVRSCFAVPLVSKGTPVGVIILAETRRVRRFSDEEIARVTAVANLVSPAITNAKMFEDLRRSYDALARAQADVVKNERLAALGELSAVIAHEVRNPLAVIYNSLGSLRRLEPQSNDAKMLLDIVGEEAARLNRIVADLLDFVRPYALHPRTTKLEALVTGAIDGARRALESTVPIDVEVTPPAAELVLDATMVQQALINLIVNAMQATPAGGTVHVRAQRSREELRFEIRDQGAGIDAAEASRIFEPFFTTKASGTGLGLAVVRRIAEALGGGVEVERGTPRGSVFVLRVPAPS
ncbi:MAG TPA: GAF domain-containing protein, partial [Labilithrix sp.]